MKGSTELRRALKAHPRYRYRGCAPDVDQPGRAAGDTSLTLDAWHGEDRDGNEPQKEREAREQAAVEVCLNCPVMVACDAYASSVVMDGNTPRLTEPEGIWGGRLARERRELFDQKRPQVAVRVPDAQVQTPQKRAVLLALAMCWDPFEVAAAAGVDVRTANWQRSSLVRLLGLPRDVSRMRVLAVARERGLLDASVVVADDGSVPAVPSPTKTTGPVQLPLWPAGRSVPRAGGEARRGVPRTSWRRKFSSVAGQGDLADVRSLFSSEPMEAAA